MLEDAAVRQASTLDAVEIITIGYAVRGNCRGLGVHLRLVDLLNNPEVTHLQLSNVRVRELPTSAEIIVAPGPMFMDKQSVILGRSLASPEEEAQRSEAHRFDYVQKQKLPMVVFAPPYRIVGNIYMIKEAEHTIALPKLFDGFLAMTEVRIFCEGVAGAKWEDDFVVVNGRSMNMVLAERARQETSLPSVA